MEMWYRRGAAVSCDHGGGGRHGRTRNTLKRAVGDGEMAVAGYFLILERAKSRRMGVLFYVLRFVYNRMQHRIDLDGDAPR